MLLHRKPLLTMPTADLSVGDTHSLTRAHHHKYLAGPLLTFDLFWSLHIANICKKTRKQIAYYTETSTDFNDSLTLQFCHFTCQAAHIICLCYLGPSSFQEHSHF